MRIWCTHHLSEIPLLEPRISSLSSFCANQDPVRLSVQGGVDFCHCGLARALQASISHCLEDIGVQLHKQTYFKEVCGITPQTWSINEQSSPRDCVKYVGTTKFAPAARPYTRTTNERKLTEAIITSFTTTRWCRGRPAKDISCPTGRSRSTNFFRHRVCWAVGTNFFFFEDVTW